MGHTICMLFYSFAEAREGAEVVASTPEYFRKVLADETALWIKVIGEMGIKSSD